MRVSENSTDLSLCIKWDGCLEETYTPSNGDYQNLQLLMTDAYCNKSDIKGADGDLCEYSGQCDDSLACLNYMADSGSG